MISYPLAVGPVLTRVLEAGPAEGPAIVLVHGLSSRADRWVRNIDALAAAGYRVLAADLPGHGFAAKNPEHDHSVGGYADFLLGLLDALKIERATLVGTSVGGHVVAAAVLKQPQRAERMMLIGSTGFAPSPPERAQAVRDWLMNLTPQSHRPRLERVINDAALVTEDMVREDVLINTSPGASACFDRFLKYMAGPINADLVGERLPEVADRVPLLLLWGVDDSSVPVAVGRAARARLPKARLVCVQGLNHTPYYEHPALFNHVLLAFMRAQVEKLEAPGLTLT